ncbi:MAG: hypothetical protein C00003105_00590 [ANME-2 cluster archaeon HR1]|nr:MAG: hypothetical protein C00003105_00590 [ANME-2 cluster archaeon HR1]
MAKLIGNIKLARISMIKPIRDPANMKNVLKTFILSNKPGINIIIDAIITGMTK